MPRKRQTGNRKRKVWRKALPTSWSRKAHRRVKIDRIIEKEGLCDHTNCKHV